MSRNALSEGARAFTAGGNRAANPFDPDSEDWLCWRDGFEQAKAAAESDRPDEPIEAPAPSRDAAVRP